MRADTQQIKRFLKVCNFLEIFKEELGWNRLREAPPTGTYRNQQYTFTPLAEKAGFKIYQYTFQARIPEEQTLKQIDRLLDAYAAEHLTIFVDANRENQAWLWVKKGANQPPVARLNRLNKNQSGELLAQKIARLFVSIDEEETTTLTKTLERVIQGFDVEKVTTRFYERFKKEHADFLKCIENITDDDDREWYTSIMLNRLMFVYFIQKKKILDNHSSIRLEGDEEYLQKRLQKIRLEYGPDNFYTFYRYFLRRLFHEGLNQPDQLRSPELERVIGKVPYINGGLFDVHMLEQRYPDIQINDKTFEQLFEFFERFDWHLDDRPMRNDREINPDVLGYIFEKYINQKQMGAYYTKEDITEYISKNTIIPFIFEKVAQRCPDAFIAGGPIWSQLRNNPTDYIYEEMAHGLLEPLPPEIEAGIADIAQRTSWNRTADERWALPTETWREVVERRRRYKEVYTKIVEGEISTINDLITYNLNITQFARDVIAACKEPRLLRAFYDTIEQVTVLDPTCGSGAFLFAALNILEPLYQGCIERMRLLVREHHQQQTKLPVTQRKESNHIRAFQQTLNRVDQHQSQEYFILKSIIINNLYGVDIMEEAIEICKLRFFLKLVAQVEKPQDLEPLPDIDFNVLAGNTLIGFTSMDEVRQIVTTKLVNIGDTEKTLKYIERQALEIERDEQSFRRMQTELGIKIDPITKQQLRVKLSDLRDVLDPYLATEYAIYESKYPDKDAYEKAYAEWKKSHKPFHWWAEFYKIMQNGGFDVIIGNPPYLDFKELTTSGVHYKGFVTLPTRNLYSLIIERCQKIASDQGKQGYIVPVSSIATEGYFPLQQIISRRKLIFSSYDDRPSHLFDGLDKNTLSILLLSSIVPQFDTMSTRLCRWNANERDQLFRTLSYEITPASKLRGCFPKIGSTIEATIWKKLFSSKPLYLFYSPKSGFVTYYSRKVNAFLQVLDFVPKVRDGQGRLRPPSEFKELQFSTREQAAAVFCCLNSTLFRWFLDITSDGSHLNRREIDNFPFDPKSVSSAYPILLELAKHLSENLRQTSADKIMRYKHDTLTVQCIFPKYSKSIIDEIDRVLAQHYGFTPEELDFIINYDIKYRMGRDNGEESEE